MDFSPFFPETFEEARERAGTWFQQVKAVWPEAQWRSKPLYPEEGLTFDWIEAVPSAARRALVLSAGLHGVEGYAGTAMLDLFIREFLSRLDPKTTALYLVPVINPWGMKHRRRTNPENVDLNRNVLDEEAFYRDLNPDYMTLAPVLHPERPVGWGDRFLFYARILRYLQREGMTGLRNIFPQGQSVFPKGMYYTGKARQPEIQALLELLTPLMERYERVVYLDMHTGYGAKGRLTLVFPGPDPRSPEELRERTQYPRVTKVAASDFYPIHGDLNTYLAKRARELGHPGLYAMALEVGTLGDTTLPQLRSMRALILENQLYWYGATSERVARWVRREFLALFYPDDDLWRRRTVAQTREAYEGIVTGLLR